MIDQQKLKEFQSKFPEPDREQYVKDFLAKNPKPQTLDEAVKLSIKGALQFYMLKIFHKVVQNPEILLEYKANQQRLESAQRGKTIPSENH